MGCYSKCHLAVRSSSVCSLQAFSTHNTANRNILNLRITEITDFRSYFPTIFSPCLHLVRLRTRLEQPTAGIEVIRSEHKDHISIGRSAISQLLRDHLTWKVEEMQPGKSCKPPFGSNTQVSFSTVRGHVTAL